MSRRKAIVYLYYQEDENYIIDSDGNIIYDIFGIVTPDELAYYKKKRGTFIVTSNESEYTVYEIDFPLLEGDE